MGQTVSGGNLSSVFNWSSIVPRAASSESDRSQDSDVPTLSHCDEEVESQQQKNSLSCFRSPNTMEEDRRYYMDSPGHSQSDSMRPIKKTCKFCRSNDDENINEQCWANSAQNYNDNCMRHYDSAQLVRNDTSEINGNQIDSIQSCSFENTNLQSRNINSTSINRYVSAVTERLEKTNLKDDSCSEVSSIKGVSMKSKEFKKNCKSKKGNFLECNGYIKESKSCNKSGAKKKNAWIRFYGSRLGKVNNSKTSTSSTCAPVSDTDSACVCTSYKKMDENIKQENEASAATASVSMEPPLIQHNLSFGWACERVNINRNSGINWSAYTGGPLVNTASNRGTECISCEGSHCHMDLNALAADISNIRRVPLNITVTRVETNRTHLTKHSEENVIVVSLGTQNFPVIDLKRLNPEVRIVEDCEVRARVRRALEIAEGVEPPAGYNAPQVVNPGDLRAVLFQQQVPTTTSLITQPAPQRARIHTQVDYIHCLVPDLRSIISCSFYWGKMDRYEAERLLDGKPEGTFLLRDSAQEEYLFSVSFRKYQRSLHARIEQFNHKFSFDSHDPCVFASDTVTGLIEHYKDPTCVMFFEPMLTVPLSRTFTFSLQHLCRAVIVSCTTYDGINELRLPPGIKAYLKEYHYRQRVRVKRFDESPESSEESQ